MAVIRNIYFSRLPCLRFMLITARKATKGEEKTQVHIAHYLRYAIYNTN